MSNISQELRFCPYCLQVRPVELKKIMPPVPATWHCLVCKRSIS
jgi:hypothetical protein